MARPRRRAEQQIAPRSRSAGLGLGPRARWRFAASGHSIAAKGAPGWGRERRAVRSAIDQAIGRRESHGSESDLSRRGRRGARRSARRLRHDRRLPRLWLRLWLLRRVSLLLWRLSLLRRRLLRRWLLARLWLGSPVLPRRRLLARRLLPWRLSRRVPWRLPRRRLPWRR